MSESVVGVRYPGRMFRSSGVDLRVTEFRSTSRMSNREDYIPEQEAVISEFKMSESQNSVFDPKRVRDDAEKTRKNGELDSESIQEHECHSEDGEVPVETG